MNYGYQIQVLGNETVNPADWDHLQEGGPYTLDQAVVLATENGLTLGLFDEQGTWKGVVQSSGEWRLL